MTQSVGIDVGKEELVACIRDTDGKTAMPAPFPNTSIGLKKLIVHFREHDIGADDPVLLESTGPYHWQAARTLADRGYFVKVANPLHTKQIARLSIRKRKTDNV
ncbi:MAG: Transposase, IS111A/IS1328/IS1533, partial [Candidatus Kaiserbacteria bacterium GW2011_GWB1_52_6]